MDEAPPPTDHVIRPHHLLVLSILMVAFKDLEIRRFPSDFALHVHRVLLQEIAEVAPHKSHQELMKEICTGPRAEAPECFEFITAIRSIHRDLTTPDKMGNFLQNIPALFIAKGAEEPRFNRRSIFGYFCRRCYVTFVKLSFSGLAKLCNDYQSWCAGDASAGYEPIHKDQLTTDLFIYKTQADKKNWAKPEAFEAWEKAQNVGDQNLAEENLRRFFEQRFHEQSDSGVRQHALLNMVRMHYLQGEYVAARKLLVEAINAARTAGDKITLHHCTSIMQRLPPEKSGDRPPLHELQPDLHPLEVLYDIKKLLDEKNEQPLNAAFIKSFQALGLYDHWLDVQLALPIEDHQWAQHAVQSILWRVAGCDKLADVEQNIVLAFTQSGGDSTNRLSIILNRAYQTARQGRYNEALAILLDPSCWAGLSMADYKLWAHYMWDILMIRASRRGQLRLMREFLLTQRPAGPFDPAEWLMHVGWDSKSTLRDLLHRVLRLREIEQAALGVDHLLKALWLSEFLCRFNIYRTAIILLADIGLEFGLNRRSRQILEEILPQIIDGGDLEQRAVGCFTFARCIIASESSQTRGLEEAIPYLLTAEKDFQILEMYPSLADAQYMLSVVYHNLGRNTESLDVARRHSETLSFQQELEIAPINIEIRRVCDAMGQVGVVLASR